MGDVIELWRIDGRMLICEPMMICEPISGKPLIRETTSGVDR